MDPITVAGTAIGAVSLSIQVLDGIFKIYKVFDACRGMPEDCQYVSTCFLIERERLRVWQVTSGLDRYEDEASVNQSIKNSRLPLLAIVTEIKSSMLRFLTLNGYYDELGVRDLNGEHHDGQNASVNQITISGEDLARALDLTDVPIQPTKVHTSFGRKIKKVGKGISDIGSDLKEIATHPKRLKWVAFDRKQAKELVKKLHEMNDCLHELLDEHQSRVLVQTTQDTYIELLQMHNTVFQLKQLVEAAVIFKPRGHTFDNTASTLAGDESSSPYDLISDSDSASLINLAKFKELNLSTVRLPANLNFEDINAPKNTGEWKGRTSGQYIMSENFGSNVWIEWKAFEVGTNKDGTLERDPEVLPRIEELALLLTSPKPKELCVPPCLGFFHTRDPEIANGHFGFVFAAPEDSSPDCTITSLSTAISKQKEPSLTERYHLASKIATSLLYLHSVNWLHKGLCSNNVVWFSSEDTIQYADAYMMGFEYFRPAREGEKTEEMPYNAATNQYRHPDIQGAGEHPFYRKTFDIYSLGILLLEIALWEDISKICPDDAENFDGKPEGDDKANSDNTADTNGVNSSTQSEFIGDVQRQILDKTSSICQRIRSKVGNKYYEAIKTCIGARISFGIASENEETDTDTAVKLQRDFKKLVVDPLKSVAL